MPEKSLAVELEELQALASRSGVSLGEILLVLLVRELRAIRYALGDRRTPVPEVL